MHTNSAMRRLPILLNRPPILRNAWVLVSANHLVCEQRNNFHDNVTWSSQPGLSYLPPFDEAQSWTIIVDNPRQVYLFSHACSDLRHTRLPVQLVHNMCRQYTFCQPKLRARLRISPHCVPWWSLPTLRMPWRLVLSLSLLRRTKPLPDFPRALLRYWRMTLTFWRTVRGRQILIRYGFDIDVRLIPVSSIDGDSKLLTLRLPHLQYSFTIL